MLTTSQLTIGRCRLLAFAAVIALWEIIEVGATDGEYDAEKDSDDDAHGATPRSPTSNAAAEVKFRSLLGHLAANCDSKPDDFRSHAVNLI